MPVVHTSPQQQPLTLLCCFGTLGAPRPGFHPRLPPSARCACRSLPAAGRPCCLLQPCSRPGQLWYSKQASITRYLPPDPSLSGRRRASPRLCMPVASPASKPIPYQSPHAPPRTFMVGGVAHRVNIDARAHQVAQQRQVAAVHAAAHAARRLSGQQAQPAGHTDTLPPTKCAQGPCSAWPCSLRATAFFPHTLCAGAKATPMHSCIAHQSKESHHSRPMPLTSGLSCGAHVAPCAVRLSMIL